MRQTHSAHALRIDEDAAPSYLSFSAFFGSSFGPGICIRICFICVCVSLSVCVCLSTHLIRKMSHKSSRIALSGQSRVKASWRRVACAKSVSQSSIFNLPSSISASKSFAPNENAVKISKIVSSEQQTPDLFHLIILLQEEFNYEQSFHSQKNRNQF